MGLNKQKSGYKFAWKAQAAMQAELKGPKYAVFRIGEYYYVFLEQLKLVAPKDSTIVYTSYSEKEERTFVYNRGTHYEREETIWL